MTATVDRTDYVIVVADLQPMIVCNSRTNSPQEIEAVAVALAQAATVLNVPLLFSVVFGPGGPASHLPGLVRYASETNTFPRHFASPFSDEAFLEALEATGRKTLVLAAYSAEAVIQFAALNKIKRGSRIVLVPDASGSPR